jgi:hypothetical protein
LENSQKTEIVGHALHLSEFISFQSLTHDIWQDDAPQDSKGLLKEDELLEEELMVLSSVNPRQMLSLQVASGEMNHLHEKVAALEGQLKDERQQRQEVIAKIEDAQHKIHLNTGKNDHSGGSRAMDGELAGHSTSEDEDIKSRKVHSLHPSNIQMSTFELFCSCCRNNSLNPISDALFH